MDSAILRLIEITKSFGGPEVLTKLTCHVAPGELVALLGPNGAGKTTALKVLLGTVRPSSGSAKVRGLDCTTESREVKKLLGYCPDEPGFFDFLTGRETLDFVSQVRRLDTKVARERVETLRHAIGLGAEFDRLVSSYSLGAKKKLAIVAALVHQPMLLLLDEPTNGLDPVATKRFTELLRRLSVDQGCAVLISTHQLGLASELCDRLLLLHQGRLVGSGTAHSLRKERLLPDDASLMDLFSAFVDS